MFDVKLHIYKFNGLILMPKEGCVEVFVFLISCDHWYSKISENEFDNNITYPTKKLNDGNHTRFYSISSSQLSSYGVSIELQ